MKGRRRKLKEEEGGAEHGGQILKKMKVLKNSEKE
jgi:hypothetical protein